MKSNLKLAMLLMLLCTLLTASGQFLFKIAAQSIELNPINIITNIPLILGLIVYAAASVCMILALRKEKLSTIFPMISLSFIWVFLIATISFQEAITTQKVIANIIIILGIILIGRGSQ